MKKTPSLLYSSLVLVPLVGLVLAGVAKAADPTFDPTRVARTGRPNDRLICPVGACAAPADEPAPVLAATPERLLEAWRAVIEAAPRTEILAFDLSDWRLVAQQRSRLFGFVDTIAVKVLALPDGRSSFAAYSRSETGYWDLGVNAARLEAWIRAVVERVESASGRP